MKQERYTLRKCDSYALAVKMFMLLQGAPDLSVLVAKKPSIF